MQLLHNENKTLVTMKEINVSATKGATIAIKNIPSSNLDMKEKRSSNTSLLLMNPVASGDNVTTGLNSTHKLKEEPSLVPCCEGKELQVGLIFGVTGACRIQVLAKISIKDVENHGQINDELVRSGLSAISVKHDCVIQCLSMSRACESMQVPPGLIKHRNSFRSLHRPDLKRVPYLRRMTPDELESLFRGYADIPTRGHSVLGKDKREEITKLTLPPDESSLKSVNKDINADGVSASALHAIPETRSGAEDVPAGMRLHGARARLYTSLLAGTKAGDQLDGISTNEELDSRVPEDIPEDEVQLHEELQIILPPRYDDITADSTITATAVDT